MAKSEHYDKRTTAATDGRCEAMVYTVAGFESRCGKPVSYEIGGKVWCAQHAPGRDQWKAEINRRSWREHLLRRDEESYGRARRMLMAVLSIADEEHRDAIISHPRVVEACGFNTGVGRAWRDAFLGR